MNAVALATRPPETVSERAEALDRELRGLGEQLRQAGARIETGEAVPGFALVEALASCHRRFLGLKRDLLTEARARGLAAPDLPPPQGLAGLRPLLDLLNEAGPGSKGPLAAPEALVPSVQPRAEVITVEAPPALSPSPTPQVLEFVSGPVESLIAARQDEPGDNTALLTIPFPADLPAPPTPNDAGPEGPPGPFHLSEIASAPEFEPSGVKTLEGEWSTPSPGLGPEVAEAQRVLDRVLSLQDNRATDPPLLADCQARARALRQTIADGGGAETVAELTSGRHPLAALVALIGPDAGLDDAAWAERHAAVAAGLGKPVALAAARGRLAFSQ